MVTNNHTSDTMYRHTNVEFDMKNVLSIKHKLFFKTKDELNYL